MVEDPQTPKKNGKKQYARDMKQTNEKKQPKGNRQSREMKF